MKKKLDGINVLYPTPTTVVGAMVKVDITKVKPLLFDSYCSLVDSDACFRYTQ